MRLTVTPLALSAVVLLGCSSSGNGGAKATATPAPKETLAACHAKMASAEKTEDNLIGAAQGYVTRLVANSSDNGSLNLLSEAAASLKAADVSIQAVTCEPQNAEFLALEKSASAALAESFGLIAQGYRQTNPALLQQGAQRLKDGLAALDRATALVKQQQP